MSLELQRLKGRGDIWYVMGTLLGERVRRSTETSDRKQAERFLAKIQKDIYDRHTLGPQATVTFAHAANSFFDAGKGGKNKSYFFRLLYEDHRAEKPEILTAFAKTALRDINQLKMDDLVKLYYPSGAPGATLLKAIYSPVSAVMKHAAKRDLCAVPNFDRPVPDAGRSDWLTVEEAERLIAASAPHFAPLLLFYLSTGCRKNEALYADWAQIDLAAGYVTIIGLTDADDAEYGTKSGRQRTVPLPARLVAELRKLPHRSGPVFLTQNGEPYTRPNKKTGRGGGHIYSALEGAAARAGISKHVHPHLTRHTFATWHIMYGTHQMELLRLGGWSDLELVQRYAHLEGIRLTPEQRAVLATWIDPAVELARPALRVVS